MSNVRKMDEWRAMRERPVRDVAGEEPELPLYGGGGGGPVEPTVNLKDYVDARDEAVEARVNLKVGNLSTKGTVWGAVATGFGLLLAILAFGGDRFDGGASISPTVSKLQIEQEKRDADQDAQLKLMDQKLDVLIKQTASK